MAKRAETGYASNTKITPDETMIGIRELLKRYECRKITTIEDEDYFGIAFMRGNRSIRFVVPMPSKDDMRAHKTHGNQNRIYDDGFSPEKYEQLVRERWRSAYLVIKGKLEAVESGIESFDSAFMGQLVLPSGQTMVQVVTPYLDTEYAEGNMPQFLLESGQ